MRSMNGEAGTFGRLALLFAVLLMVAPTVACGGAGGNEADAGNAMHEADDAEGENHAVANAPMEHAEGEMNHAANEVMDHEEGIDHVHPAGEDIPGRADEEERDEYSKPLEVYAFAGFGDGDTIVDVGAASGYNTYFVSKLVGPSGRVYAVSGNEGLAARIEAGDMAGTTNVIIPENAAAVPDGVADAVLLVREYHLAGSHEEFLAEINRMLKPGGTVALVEVRIGEREGYDDTTHRNGEDTVIAQFEAGGFSFVGESDILRRDDDDYSAYGGSTGVRYVTDRMLLTFRKQQ
jgi:predicted methyltransferase